ncbi:MAG: transposase [Candidatus Kapaibacterium sp.]
MKHYIGIDVGSTECVAAICSGLSATKPQPSFTFANTTDGITAFTNWLKSQKCSVKTSIICMESCGVYADSLCYLLTTAKWKVAVEAPLKVARAMPPNASKTDALDAHRIARYSARFIDELTIWLPPEASLELSTTLLALREGYTKQSTQLQNQRTSFKRKHIRSPYAENMLADDIKRLKAQIKQIDKKIMLLIRSDKSLSEMFKLIHSVPGVGPNLAVYMMIVTDCFSNGDNEKQLAAFLGISPLEYQSGTSVKKKPRSRGFGHRTIRKLLYLGALSAIQFNKKIKAYFERLVGFGKNKHLVINNVENKIVGLICAVIRSGVKFNKEYVPKPKFVA